VRDGRMPKPFRIDGLVRWDIRRVDAALDNLANATADNPWDKVA
jgi:predicted DNA-binding transcriptional regulator AlpA